MRTLSISSSWVKSRNISPGTAAISHRAMGPLLNHYQVLTDFPEPVTAFLESMRGAQGVRENWLWQFSPHCHIALSVLCWPGCLQPTVLCHFLFSTFEKYFSFFCPLSPKSWSWVQGICMEQFDQMLPQSNRRRGLGNVAQQKRPG